jgi:Glyoxalase-like domain
MIELDHVILFVAGPGELLDRQSELEGFVLEPGRRHGRQNTRNQRIVFERNYIELVWRESPAEMESVGLGSTPRYTGAPGACRYGVVLRGRLPAGERDRFITYTVPDGSGTTLSLLAESLAEPRLPFVGLVESDDQRFDSRWPVHWATAPWMRHPNGAAGITQALITSAAVPDLGRIAPRDVSFVTGEPQLQLTLRGMPSTWVWR